MFVQNNLFTVIVLSQTCLVIGGSRDDYINFSDMGNYDHSVQQNRDKKFSQFGMGAGAPVVETRGGAHPGTTNYEACNALSNDDCVRATEYLRRIVKSLLRQMNVHSHVFGPGEAITIDLQAELKYDDYVVLSKFTNADLDFNKYLYRIDEIMSNFIHVVDHTGGSRFDFDAIINFPAFYSLKFWVILSTSMVVGSLIVLLLVKAFNTRKVHNLLLYGFLIIFIMSCVWSYSSMYEDKKAEIMSHMAQSNGLPPKDCDYQNWSASYSAWYWLRIHVFGYKDQCGEYYQIAMTDPFWKVNPMEAISTSAAYFVFKPLGYIGERLGEFYVGFVSPAPWLMKPIMFAVIVLFTILFILGPFRISTPMLTIEPAWRPELPGLDRRFEQQLHAIRQVRNEIMERPDGPVIKSVRDASTDMDGFQQFLTDEDSDEHIIGPFARFNSIKDGISDSSSNGLEIKILERGRDRRSDTKNPEKPNTTTSNNFSSGSRNCGILKELHSRNQPPENVLSNSMQELNSDERNVPDKDQIATEVHDHQGSLSCSNNFENDLVHEDLLLDALKEDKDTMSPMA